MEINNFTAHHRFPSFVEREWAGAYSREDLRQKWWLDRGLIAWFVNSNQRLMLKIEVGPLHQKKRLELLHALRSQGVVIRDSAFEDGKKYTSIFTSFLPLKNWESKEAISQTMIQMYDAAEYQELKGKIERALSNIIFGDVDFYISQNNFHASRRRNSWDAEVLEDLFNK
ncbi:hypothetical protein [Paenisporosarcina sp. OV554]|uniref:hypothetical protein n=1 Tax=Paenisporosarcina sp. OV554 TaxID=2135694 RepID=UPI000D3BB4E9|nr:hypothetical protein [Paenisporosarcina sp. OV554]PUB11998.1 hypothetical protein C8K15_11188 [Paenisporosarcina sp. OV554]